WEKRNPAPRHRFFGIAPDWGTPRHFRSAMNRCPPRSRSDLDDQECTSGSRSTRGFFEGPRAWYISAALRIMLGKTQILESRPNDYRRSLPALARSIVQENGLLDAKKSRQLGDVLEPEFSLARQDLGNRRNRQSRRRRQAALSDIVDFQQVTKHVHSGNRRHEMVLVLVLLDKHGERKKILRFISSPVVPKVAQAIEHCDCLPVLRLGANDAQGTFTNQIQIAITGWNRRKGHALARSLLTGFGTSRHVW